MKNKLLFNIFFSLVVVALVAPLINFTDLLFPYVTGKAFFLRMFIEAALPFYVTLLILEKPLRPNIKNPLHISVAVFLLVSLIAALLGINPSRSLWGNFERMGGVYYLAHLTLLYFYVVLIGQKGGVYIKRLILYFFAVAAAVSVNGLFGKMGAPLLIKDPSLPDRVSSTLGNPIFLASFLIPALALSLFFYLGETEKNKKWGYLILSALFLLLIYFTGTRGAFVGLLIGTFLSLVVYLFFAPGKTLRLKVGSGLAVIAVCAALLLVFGKHLPENSTLRRLSSLNDSNAQARLIQWKTAVHGFTKYPILGVGPENYYYISNKFYNPEMAKYDPSWFDKPHNYILEILTTTGALGMLAYLSAIIFVVWAYLKAKRAELITGSEAAVLIFGIAAYQIQNLFVFDTASASMSYFLYLGFAGYLWHEASLPSQAENGKKNSTFSFAHPVFLGSLLVTLYVIYISNILPMQLAQYVNAGLSLQKQQKFEESKQAFEAAKNLNFDFDFSALFQKYSDMALDAAQSDAKLKVGFVKEALAYGVSLGKESVKKDATNPIDWYYLSSLSYFDGVINGQKGIPQDAVQALAEAAKLAPTRKEMLFLDIKYKEGEGNYGEALKAAQNYFSMYPTVSQATWELAWVYYKSEDLDKAFEFGQKAVAQGQVLTAYSEYKLFADYYQSKKDFAKVVEYYKKAVDVAPNNIDAYIALLKAYVQNGQMGEAREFATKILASAPDRKPQIDSILSGNVLW